MSRMTEPEAALLSFVVRNHATFDAALGAHIDLFTRAAEQAGEATACRELFAEQAASSTRARALLAGLVEAAEDTVLL